MKCQCFCVAIFLVAFGSGASEARVRDEVMVGASRCIVIADGRQWLNCYYGAAQPLRSQLGLPPAPLGDIQLATAPLSGANMPEDQAEARDEVMSEAFHCTSIGEDRPWLDCYYAAAQQMRAQLGLSTAPQAQLRNGTTSLASSSRNVAIPTLAEASRGGEEFGSAPKPSLPEQKIADHIVSQITAYKFDSSGIFTLTLTNGQTWRQIEGDTTLARLASPASNYTITIKRGFFGSYNLTIKGVPGLFRVHRIL